MFKEKDWFIVTNEYKMGHTPTGELNLDAEPAPVEDTKRLDICNGFRIWLEPDERNISICEKGGYFIIVDFWIGNSWNKLWAKRRGMPANVYIDKTVDLLLNSIEKHRRNFWWCVTGEPDTQCKWPNERFQFRKKAYHWFKRFLLDFVPCGRDKDISNWSEYLKKRRINPKNNIAIQCALPFTTHYSYELGVRLVWMEINCLILPSVQIGIAFIRGASRQNKGYWGIDVSTHGDPAQTFTFYDSKGKRQGGCTESLLLREWIASYISGANLLHQELSDSSHWITTSDGRKRLSPLGKIAKKFAKFSLNKSANRGIPYTPVALMLEHYHGWSPAYTPDGVNKVWCGKVHKTRGDFMIDNFFDLAFPGYRNIYSGFAKLYSKKPWLNPKEYIKFLRNRLDARSYETGRLTDSRWGDIFDVVLENCPLDVLKKYKVIILLGNIKVNSTLRNKLMGYINSGGVVVLNITHFIHDPEEDLATVVNYQGLPDKRIYKINKEDEVFLGVKFTGIKKDSNLSECSICKKSFIEQGFVYELVKPTTAKIIGTTPYGCVWGPVQKEPIVTVNKIGKGKVILTLPYLLHAGDTNMLLEIGKDIYHHIIEDVSIIKIDGMPIQYLINRTTDGLIVTLINNRETKWAGYIVLNKKDFKCGLELWKGKKIGLFRENGNLKFTLAIEPFGFRICKLY
ncbi:MAG: hypothetical protein HY606_09405 [Planctomycetes bacterium]|nr:hypothetical protein [Planctomycetota bacterium]